MSQRINNSFKTDNTNKRKDIHISSVGIVVDIILDDTSKNLENTDDPNFSTGKNTSVIGSCIIRETNNQVISEANLPSYPPLDALNIDMPLVGETVELVKVGNSTYYRRINTGNINRGNAVRSFNKNVYPTVESPTNTADSYNRTSQTGIVNSNNNTDRDTKIGEYFDDIQINKLRLYEGDKLIQSRYGQSIRFSGYNNSDNTFAPTILIRNRQNDVISNQSKSGDIIEEDVNRDGSTIAIVSAQYKLPFQPGIVDDGGSSNFDTKPENFDEYPSELVGNDQILINSERIILSAKSKEMIFYSKGNWGFISDGKMSIDNGKHGANLNFNGDVTLTTNDNSTYILGGQGNIYLNTEVKDEPLVRGATLKDIMERMFDLIVQQVYQTPAGPTSIGPTNQGEFKRLRAELSDMLSELNFTDKK